MSKVNRQLKLYGIIMALFIIFIAACDRSSNILVTETDAPTAVAEPINLPENFEVWGHRGAPGLKPENTIPSFETALDLSVTALDLDVHLTADQEVVIWADPTLTPTKCELDIGQIAGTYGPDDGPLFEDVKTNLVGGNLRLSEIPYQRLRYNPYSCHLNPDPVEFPEQIHTATELAGCCFSAGTSYRLITLGQLFQFVDRYSQAVIKTAVQRDNASQVQFSIELHHDPEVTDTERRSPLVTAVLAIIEEYELTERVILQSFDPKMLWTIHQTKPDIHLARLTQGETPQLSELAAQSISVWAPHYQDVTAELVTQAHDAGLKVIPWVMNNPSEMAYLISLGVDGLTTDRPDLVDGAGKRRD